MEGVQGVQEVAGVRGEEKVGRKSRRARDVLRKLCVSAPDLSRCGTTHRPGTRPMPFESIIERGGFGFGMIINAARREAATRRGSNPARSNGIRMAHQQRAEIFALPLNTLAIRATICSIFSRHGHLYL
jgi:hypothetical protein